jgi:penicillin amidase
VSGFARRSRWRRVGGWPFFWLAASIGVAWMALQSFRDHAAERAAFPIEQGRIAVRGLTAELQISRDARGFPHIEARSAADSFFGWGFVHAQDRLAQMLTMRMSARGRSAETVGREGLEADRWARTIGFQHLADAQFDAMDLATRALLVAYTAGVNARIDRIGAAEVAPPVAIRGLDFPLEPWQPADSLALAKLYSWNLANTVEVSLVLRDINERMGSRTAKVFFPRGSGSGVHSPRGVTAGIDREPPRSFARPAARVAQGPPELNSSRLRRSRPQHSSEAPGLRRLARGMGLDGRGVGSSAWVLDGRNTESGHPILAADSHLEPTVPSLFHVSQVRGGDFEATGAAIPGIPVYWTGYNAQIAWASTHANAATIDLYEEKLGDSDPDQYHDGGRWRPVARRSESLAVRRGASEELEVRTTGHGPLIHGLLEGENEPLALAWVGAQPEVQSPIATMNDVARSGSAAALLVALSGHHEPPLAIVYADGSGSRGLQVAAWLPVRPLPTDLVPLPGRARWYDWAGRVPFEQLPRSSGHNWVIAADNPLAGDEQGTKIDWLWRSGARTQRIEALLRAESKRGGVDLRRMAALQADVVSQRAPKLVASALALAGTEREWSIQARDVVLLLRDWDGRSTPESVGASAYHVFVENLTASLLGLSIGDELTQRYRALREVDTHAVLIELIRLANAGGLPALDEVAPEQIQEAVRQSLRDTWLQLSYRLGANHDKWGWGRLHRLSFRAFEPNRWGDRLEAMFELPYGGSSDSVNTGEFQSSETFDLRVASTFRIVVDVGSLDKSLVAIAPGESEHPQHPHYRDNLTDWLSGNAGLLTSDKVLVRESGPGLILQPAP